MAERENRTGAAGAAAVQTGKAEKPTGAAGAGRPADAANTAADQNPAAPKTAAGPDPAAPPKTASAGAQTLLIADDEEGILEMLRAFFSPRYRVLTARSGEEAVRAAQQKPDLILLDIQMPGMDGLAVCRAIRGAVACPILFLTARIEPADRVCGLRAGADDYILKPFDLDELAARIEAHLRRERRRSQPGTVRLFGELAVDYAARSVTVRGEPVAFSRREFEILELLSLHPGQVFDREHIYEAVWGIDGEGSSDTVMEHVRKIRLKLARHTSCGYIETVWGCGYKWNG